MTETDQTEADDEANTAIRTLQAVWRYFRRVEERQKEEEAR